MTQPALSVTILTKNNEDTIEQCIKSVAWADQVIVLDSGSTDTTLEICKQYTDEIYRTDDWPGFGIQKNRALDYANGDWVLSLDSDEVVTPVLCQTIQETLQHPQFDHYKIRRQSFFLGKLIRFGSWRHDQPLRLFKRGCVRFDKAIVHEGMIKRGKSGLIKASILHYSYNTLEEYLEKNSRYVMLGAQKRFDQGKRSTPGLALIKGLYHFFRTYLLKLGFLDGKEGLIIGMGNFFNCYYRNIALWQLERQKVKTNHKK